MDELIDEDPVRVEIYYRSLYKCYDDANAPPNANAYILYCTVFFSSLLLSTRSLARNISYSATYTTKISRLMYTASVVHLPHIHQLLSSCPCNLIREFLVAESLPRGLDDVHLVPRAGRAGGEILEAGGACKLEDQVLAAESKACALLAG